MSTTLLVGLLSGALWAAINFVALRFAARAWMRSAEFRWRSALWFLIKFPLLYVTAWLLLRQPLCSPAGFAAGFTLVLIAGGAIVCARLAFADPSTGTAHGR